MPVGSRRSTPGAGAWFAFSGGGVQQPVDQDERRAALLVARQVVLDGGELSLDARRGLRIVAGEAKRGFQLCLIDAVHRLAAGDVDRTDGHARSDRETGTAAARRGDDLAVLRALTPEPRVNVTGWPARPAVR